MKKLFALFFLCLLLAFRPADERPTLFLCGDSTLADKAPIDAPETGWGMVLPQYFTDAIEIQNHAVNGRSTKSFRDQGLWQKVMNKAKKGDWIFIQFGHNDQKITDSARYAAPPAYKENLKRFVAEAREKGANPVLLTPINRRKFDDNGAFIDQHANYPNIVREVARELQVPLIDLHAKSQRIIEQHGPEGSKKLFMHYVGGIFWKHPKGITDDTHFSPYGAALMASAAMEGLFELGSPLRSFAKTSVFPEKYEYELPKHYTPVFRKDTFNIARYGALADGRTLCTQAINQAIEVCSQAGGGTVVIPKGLWLTGPLVMRSNVNLHLEKSALLQFSRNRADYPVVRTTWEGQESFRCQAPISGFDLQNVGITGQGVIDGGGEAWRMIKRDKLTTTEWARLQASGGVLNEKGDTWYPSVSSLKGNNTPNAGRILNGVLPSDAEIEKYRDFLRPNMLSLTRCQHLIIEGITFQNSPAWTMHPLLCDHITVRNVQVKNFWYAQNSDAIDLESCRNGVIEGCTFDTGDDGITIKSGRDEQGRKRGVPTENFIVRNCVVYHAHGGFVIGSEMSGGVRNMYVHDCTFMGTDVGLRFKTARGRGGIVEKIYVQDINMTNIWGEAIIFDMYYATKDPVPLVGESTEPPAIQFQPLSDGTPVFREFFVRNIHCLGAGTGIMVRGLPEMPVKDVLIENAYIEAQKGLVCIEAEGIALKNVGLITQDPTVMQVQNGKNITLDNIRCGTGKETLLKIMGENAKGIKLLHTDPKTTTNGVVLGQGVKAGVWGRK